MDRHFSIRTIFLFSAFFTTNVSPQFIDRIVGRFTTEACPNLINRQLFLESFKMDCSNPVIDNLTNEAVEYCNRILIHLIQIDDGISPEVKQRACELVVSLSSQMFFNEEYGELNNPFRSIIECNFYAGRMTFFLFDQSTNRWVCGDDNQENIEEICDFGQEGCREYCERLSKAVDETLVANHSVCSGFVPVVTERPANGGAPKIRVSSAPLVEVAKPATRSYSRLALSPIDPNKVKAGSPCYVGGAFPPVVAPNPEVPVEA